MELTFFSPYQPMGYTFQARKVYHDPVRICRFFTTIKEIARINMFYGLQSDADVEVFRKCIVELLRIFGTVYAADDLITIRRNAGFLSDEALAQSIASALEYIHDPQLRLQAESKKWRLHTLTWAAQSVLHLPGDFVECGVFDGFSAHVIAQYVNFSESDKKYYLYDSFCGLSTEDASEQELLKNAFYEQHPEVRGICESRFGAFMNVIIVQGFIPEVLSLRSPSAVSLLHIDLNCARAELGAIDFFFDRVVEGGIVIFDDYGKLAFCSQKTVIDLFVTRHGHTVLELPTGQGLLIKKRSIPILST